MTPILNLMLNPFTQSGATQQSDINGVALFFYMIMAALFFLAIIERKK